MEQKILCERDGEKMNYFWIHRTFVSHRAGAKIRDCNEKEGIFLWVAMNEMIVTPLDCEKSIISISKCLPCSQLNAK
jgi:hypothetical protein